MAFGHLYRYDATNQLLDRAKKIEYTVNRKLTEQDIRYSLTLTDTYHMCNTAITQLFLIKAVVEKMEDPDLFYIITNFRRVLNSLIKQRNKGWAIRCALNATKPTPEEIESIDRYIRETKKRIEFIEKVVIPENLKLTPLQEYLDIIGKKTLHEDICTVFPTRKDMARANNGENPEALEKYVCTILYMVKSKGLENKYKERLQTYKEIAEKHYTQLDEEKRNAKNAENRRLAEEAMIRFQRMFNNAVFNYKSDSRIKIGSTTITKFIEEYGRNVYFILCCYVFAKRTIYRYIGEDGLVVYFKASKVFYTKDEAEKATEEYRERYPDRLFETVQLSCIETE